VLLAAGLAPLALAVLAAAAAAAAGAAAAAAGAAAAPAAAGMLLVLVLGFTVLPLLLIAFSAAFCFVAWMNFSTAAKRE
jgi:nitrate reductase NapE component